MAQKITKHRGKGSTSEVLPSRHAVSQLTAGDAFQRSISNYAKLTPSGESALGSPSVLDMSKVEY